MLGGLLGGPAVRHDRERAIAQHVADGLTEPAGQQVCLHQVGGGTETLGFFDQRRVVILAEDDDQQVARFSPSR